MKKGIVIVLLSALVGGLTAFAVVRTADRDVKQVVVSSDGAAYRTVNLAQTDYPDFTYAAESAVDAVVYVKVTAVDVRRSAPSSIFDFFFGYEGTPEKRERVGSGSGVIIRPDGYIVTNNHVVEGASSITVYYANKTSGRATLIWNDPAMDLAVIKTSINMPYLKAGNNELVSSGQEVIAVGTPLTLQFKHTVTKGIISATNRTIEVENEDGTTSYLQNLFQHDASINPGNSGGPLINEKGEVIGINTLKVSQAEGIGFAIPVQIAMPVVNHISQDGSYTTPYLGIFGFDSEIAVFYGRTLNKNGVYVVNVDSNGPLGRAGIKEGDIIIGVEDLPITTMLDLRKTIYNYKVGEKINIKILREGFEKIFEIKLENRK